MSQEGSKDNEISQDFEELVKNKDESPTNKSESDASLSANSPEEDDDNEEKQQQIQQQMQQQQKMFQEQQMQQKMFQEQQMQQKMQQKMFQEQQMQQKMFQEQQKMQNKVPQKIVNNRHNSDSDDDDSDEKSVDLKKGNIKKENVKNVKKENVKKIEEKSKVVENFSNERSLNKTLALLGVLFALFFVFSSAQLEGVLGGVSYISNLPFAPQVNLVIRGLLFVLVYFLLDYFVL